MKLNILLSQPTKIRYNDLFVFVFYCGVYMNVVSVVSVCFLCWCLYCLVCATVLYGGCGCNLLFLAGPH